MAGINDYSNTPSLNTTINTIDVDEGCNPANINDAIRQLMADIADVDDGVVPLQTPDINGGTIDGASLGASSPITSAIISGDLTVNTDALKVDSTNKFVGIGTASPSAELDIQADVPSIKLTDTDGTNQIGLIYENAGNLFLQSQNDTTNGGIGFRTYDGTTLSDTVRITGDGRLGIGIVPSNARLEVSNGDSGVTPFGDVFFEDDAGFSLALATPNTDSANINFADPESNNVGQIGYDHSNNSMTFNTNGSEAIRINEFGYVGIDQTNPVYLLHIRDAGAVGSSAEIGLALTNSGNFYFQTDNANQVFFNDTSTSAGTHNYIFFRYQGATIGDIDTTNNTTIRYNTFTGGHWSQFHDGTNPELKKGTVMSLTGDKLEYSKCEKTVIKEDGTEEVQKFEIAGTHEIGSEVTVPNDDYGEENSTTTATVVSNYNADHLVKVKVSDSIADKAVYGVWAGKYNDGDLSVEALGTSTIRIKQGEVLEVGDLLESAGDGTAQKQTDDTIKNSTIAKVTSPNVIETFDDNSFLVSCVLYCG